MNEQRWLNLSFVEQMGNIGSEISRAREWDDKNDREARDCCLERALDLIDLTKNDAKLFRRRKELCYLHEILADKYIDAKVYDVSLADLEQYCLDFALVANKDR